MAHTRASCRPNHGLRERILAVFFDTTLCPNLLRACPVQEGLMPPNDAYQPLKFPNRTTDITSMNNALFAPIILPCSGVSTDGEILTVTDVAQFLRVPKTTVYKLARGGELPASKIGKHWRFLRRDIQEWMHSRSSAATSCTISMAAAPNESSGNDQGPL